MKGKTVLAIVLGLQIGFSSMTLPAEATFQVNAPIPATLMVNGQLKNLTKEPILIQEKTYIVAQDAAKVLQATWNRNGNTGTLEIGESRLLTFLLDQEQVTVNGQKQENGEHAVLRDQEVYLPLRWVVEQAGHEISWNAQQKKIEIITVLKEGGLTLLEPDSLTAEEQKFVESVKMNQGIHQQGNLFVIARGESPNPGYGLKVTGTQWTWEQLIVSVKLTSPDPDKMYPQVITYPYVVAKAELPPYTTVVFVDADTNKVLFSKEQE
ncbi:MULTISPECIES: stalk domain-containing protein [Brevibacillus]|uniref:Protease complex subunit PrcB family protein n=1 Tax=Brevibacillus invocatus TaxID=173959 RepID=A0A3M8CGV0_9BACL|nr:MULTISPECIES: stalk domain-containing protein [Brevibacillus]MDH4617065.1 protease complex subunit PrcB family protein [Brevibacillus sp. AY1]RNB74859.1 protease complex subunit PrcB family protein [Brevibacillus invocatus]